MFHPRAKAGNVKSAGAGAALGLVAGLAAGLFLRSKKGKELTKDLEKQLDVLQKEVSKKLASVERVTKDIYEKAVDEVVDLYAKGKNSVKAEVPVLRRELRKRAKTIVPATKAATPATKKTK